jgi:hypothetical protein
MSGYLDYFGLRGWYDSLNPDVQEGICTAAECPGDFGFKSEWLFNRDISYTTQTAVNLLCNIALNALHSRDHNTCDVLMGKASQICKSSGEEFYFNAIAERVIDEKRIYPDQKRIDEHKPIVYNLVRDNPGILQSEIKKRFPVDLENIVGLAYWSIYQAGAIRREKKGRSFQLWVVD